MSLLTTSITQVLSVLTVLGQVLIILLLVVFFTPKNKTSKIIFSYFTKKNALVLTFAVALIATAGSLYYSEIAGFTPCKLCWFQRIFMYPQVVLLAIALWKKDRGIAAYNIALSVIGAIIAAYHYLLQIGVAPSLPCSAVGVSVSCSQRFIMHFGYITIPMMALTAFLLIIVFDAALMVSSKSNIGK